MAGTKEMALSPKVEASGFLASTTDSRLLSPPSLSGLPQEGVTC